MRPGYYQGESLMLLKFTSRLAGTAAIVSCMLTLSDANAITVTIDGISSPTLLSDAVDTCMSSTAGPHVINITTDTLSVPDRQVVITQPVTINGDANNNDIPCDILADMTNIRAGVDAGIQGFKSYIEIQATGLVAINDLNIHPNDDGAFSGFNNSPANNVSGIRLFKPALASDTGTYNLTNVGVSGSDANDVYLPVGNGADLYNAGTKRWAGLGPADANEVNHVKHGAIHFSDNAVGLGSVVSTLDHCEAGLSKGCALSITAPDTTVQVLGGVYGHCARDGIRVAGSNVTIKGTSTDRVRVLRSTNIEGGNAHTIEIVGGGVVPLLEYVDVAGESSGNGIAVRDGEITEISHLRVLGKFPETDPRNHAVILASAASKVGVVRDSTIHGHGSPIGDPLGINADVVNPVQFQDTIFTSFYTTETIFVGSTTPAVATFDNCALTSDGLEGESMADPAITGPDSGLPFPGVVVINNAIYTSPQYLLTLEDYDWSDTQGATDPLNGPGNHNVLRPSNVAYLTAGTGGTPLTGGAGPLLSGIDAGTWMLME